MRHLNLIAFIGLLLLISNLFIFGQDGDGSWDQMQLHSKILLVWGMLGGLFLWISMLIDHFKHSRVKRKVIWGLFLVFGQLFAAAVYFLFVYLRAKK